MPPLSAPRLFGKNILIAGSISKKAPSDSAARAREFIKAVTRCINSEGGRPVIYLANEPLDADGNPLLFDWTIAREIDALCPTHQSVPQLILVTASKNLNERMTPEERAFVSRLAMRNVCELVTLPDELVTGGNIGDMQAEYADAMIAVGGGKGVTDRFHKLAKRKVPTLASDIRIAGFSEDGDGAVGLSRLLMSTPSSLMPFTSKSAVTSMMGLSLDTPVQPIEDIAAGFVNLLANELAAKQDAARTDVLILTALPVELGAAKMAFDVPSQTPPRRTESGVNYWRSQQRRADGTTATCDIVCFGGAGNVQAATMTSNLLSELSPSNVVMTGIAAGLRDKCKLGQVVIGDRVVAYEGMAIVDGVEEPRPEQYVPTLRTRQDISAYLSDKALLQIRLEAAWSHHDLSLPSEGVDATTVSKSPLPQQSTIACGEKLFRDAARFNSLKALHGKIEVIEMESVGVYNACQHFELPALVVRGISDFGDSTKNNQFHEPAAKAAALVACDIVRNCLRS